MKIMLCNVGWSDTYQGTFLKGDHEFIKKHKGDGSERWNFKRFPDGNVYGYIRGMGINHSPPQLRKRVQNGWTLFFYAKDPHDKTLKFVGFYRNATIYSDWKVHPINKRIAGDSENHPYCAMSSEEYAELFPEGQRPIVGKGFGQAGFVYLTDPDTGRIAPGKLGLYKRIVSYLEGNGAVTRVERVANDKSPITIDPDQRMAVELASMKLVKAQLKKEGFTVTDVSSDKIGYDLRAAKAADILCIEVKGTAGAEPRFIITRNEIGLMQKDPSSRIAIVTNALTRPKLHVVKGFSIEECFRLLPLQYAAVSRGKNSYISSDRTNLFT